MFSCLILNGKNEARAFSLEDDYRCVMPTAVRRVAAPILLATFLALALTALVVALAPGAFFRLTTEEGEAVRRIAMPGPIALVGLGLLVGGLFAASFLWLRWSPSFPLAAVVVVVIGVQAGAYTAYQLWEFHESPEFCVRTCHVMEPTYLTFAEPGDNLMMSGHLENGTATCLDCHTGPGVKGQADLMATAARHIWKYAVTGNYDAKSLGGNDSVGTVPDKNCVKCHQDGLKGELPEEHARFDEQCALCHSPHDRNATGYAFPDTILKVDDCSRCHREAPLDFVLNPTRHVQADKDVEESCRECHAGHGTKDPDAIKGCTDTGCHDQDPLNNASLPALKHVAYNETACEECHGKAHDLQPIPLDALRGKCLDCHEGQRLFDDPVHGTWDLHLNVTALDAPLNGTAPLAPPPNATGAPKDDCTACHGASPPIGKPVTLGSHGGLECAQCHQPGNALGAPPLSFTVTNQSQVSWMRQVEHNFANWTIAGRGNHDPAADCGQCHAPHKTATPVFPPEQNSTNCTSSCHSWLQLDIDQAGFRGASSKPSYRGPIDPATLLANATLDVDSDGRNHKVVWDTFGCTGLCHNPQANLTNVEAWGVPLSRSEATGLATSVLPTFNASAIHGYVTKCTDCHRVASPLGGPDDLHSTHGTLVGGERPLADPGGPTGCNNYCHDKGPYPEFQSGGCYNCHLSGHDPTPHYWEAAPTLPPLPLSGRQPAPLPVPLYWIWGGGI